LERTPNLPSVNNGDRQNTKNKTKKQQRNRNNEPTASWRKESIKDEEEWLRSDQGAKMTAQSLADARNKSVGFRSLGSSSSLPLPPNQDSAMESPANQLDGVVLSSVIPQSNADMSMASSGLSGDQLNPLQRAVVRTESTYTPNIGGYSDQLDRLGHTGSGSAAAMNLMPLTHSPLGELRLRPYPPIQDVRQKHLDEYLLRRASNQPPQQGIITKTTTREQGNGKNNNTTSSPRDTQERGGGSLIVAESPPTAPTELFQGGNCSNCLHQSERIMIAGKLDELRIFLLASAEEKRRLQLEMETIWRELGSLREDYRTLEVKHTLQNEEWKAKEQRLDMQTGELNVALRRSKMDLARKEAQQKQLEIEYRLSLNRLRDQVTRTLRQREECANRARRLEEKCNAMLLEYAGGATAASAESTRVFSGIGNNDIQNHHHQHYHGSAQENQILHQSLDKSENEIQTLLATIRRLKGEEEAKRNDGDHLLRLHGESAKSNDAHEKVVQDLTRKLNKAQNQLFDAIQERERTAKLATKATNNLETIVKRYREEDQEQRASSGPFRMGRTTKTAEKNTKDQQEDGVGEEMGTGWQSVCEEKFSAVREELERVTSINAELRETIERGLEHLDMVDFSELRLRTLGLDDKATLSLQESGQKAVLGLKKALQKLQRGADTHGKQLQGSQLGTTMAIAAFQEDMVHKLNELAGKYGKELKKKNDSIKDKTEKLAEKDKEIETKREQNQDLTRENESLQNEKTLLEKQLQIYNEKWTKLDTAIAKKLDPDYTVGKPNPDVIFQDAYTKATEKLSKKITENCTEQLAQSQTEYETIIQNLKQQNTTLTEHNQSLHTTISNQQQNINKLQNEQSQTAKEFEENLEEKAQQYSNLEEGVKNIIDQVNENLEQTSDFKLRDNATKTQEALKEVIEKIHTRKTETIAQINTNKDQVFNDLIQNILRKFKDEEGVNFTKEDREEFETLPTPCLCCCITRYCLLPPFCKTSSSLHTILILFDTLQSS